MTQLTLIVGDLFLSKFIPWARHSQLSHPELTFRTPEMRQIEVAKNNFRIVKGRARRWSPNKMIWKEACWRTIKFEKINSFEKRNTNRKDFETIIFIYETKKWGLFCSHQIAFIFFFRKTARFKFRLISYVLISMVANTT